MSEEKNGSSNSIYLHLCDLFSKVQNIQICWYPLYDKTVLSIMLWDKVFQIFAKEINKFLI